MHDVVDYLSIAMSLGYQSEAISTELRHLLVLNKITTKYKVSSLKLVLFN